MVESSERGAAGDQAPERGNQGTPDQLLNMASSKNVLCPNPGCGWKFPAERRFCPKCGATPAAHGADTAPRGQQDAVAGSGGAGGWVPPEQPSVREQNRADRPMGLQSQHPLNGDVGYAETHHTSTVSSDRHDQVNTTTTSEVIGEGGSKDAVGCDKIGAGGSKKIVSGVDMSRGDTTNTKHIKKITVHSNPLYFMVLAVIAILAVVYVAKDKNVSPQSQVVPQTEVQAPSKPAPQVQQPATDAGNVAEVRPASEPAKVTSAQSTKAAAPVPPKTAKPKSLKSSVAGQSFIVATDGSACLDQYGSRQDAESAAMAKAKERASEMAAGQYGTAAAVKILNILDKGWDAQCYRVSIQAETVSESKAAAPQKIDALLADPTAPLAAKIWTEKAEYRTGEKIRVYLKGNKPFYGRVVYRDASGNLLQLLPNTYRSENYFNGGMVYEVPSAGDRFDLEVTAPFGTENLILYASTRPLGNITTQDAGGVYSIQTSFKDLPMQTRGVALRQKSTSTSEESAAEFFEGKAEVHTQN